MRRHLAYRHDSVLQSGAFACIADYSREEDSAYMHALNFGQRFYASVNNTVSRLSVRPLGASVISLITRISRDAIYLQLLSFHYPC